jgi:2,3,4,5-tetrahydropyridine-2,6-dicarboxylate N-succinyltransferase
MTTLQTVIDQAWEDRASLSPASAPKEVVDAVESVIADLNKGRIRVAEKYR